ncbi:MULTISPECIES: YdiH family protein [Tenebrionibacter/Tenebrionicola group]|jgi:hypothetical protein|uniref:Uncharacterized protein n=2 Tax=Tenebrionibacter/Tenebrionicola group TaxID=2969848 RepID=A0A8K0V410_9ENTR|nr:MULTISPECIES: YdiH family protein [Tenebrionibacter/Tenebrionicola group]MBK4713742.1 hypothetical protein [Tenebrionibacter intestinalis]MBV4411648.1 hypothetical protein [Tenebrionicola larvae]MBV5094623.1 hypothetical protein [Tenebrionicola larvae]
MDTDLTATRLAFEFLRREKESLTPAQFLTRVRQLRLEFEDLMELTSSELIEEISFAYRLGIH